MILVLSQINLAIENLRIYKEFYELEPSIKCQYNSYFFLSKSQIFLEKTITNRKFRIPLRQLSALLMPRLELPLIILMTWICLHFCFQLECY